MSPARGRVSPNVYRQRKLNWILVTPQEYKDAVSFHARQTPRQSPYPGQNFEDLDLFLQRSNTTVRIFSNSQGQPSRPPFATLYTLQSVTNTTTNIINNTAASTTNRKIDLVDEPTHLSQLLRSGSPGQSKSFLLFFAGYPCSEWLTTVGSLCYVDPEHYQRHLGFLSRQSYFSTPSLPSATENIITLGFTTLGSRHPKGNSQDHIDQLRADGLRDMNAYIHNLKLSRGENVKNGDSIVRRYSVHDGSHFSIEQEISISLNYFDKQWIGESNCKVLSPLRNRLIPR